MKRIKTIPESSSWFGNNPVSSSKSGRSDLGIAPAAISCLSSHFSVSGMFTLLCSVLSSTSGTVNYNINYELLLNTET